MNQIEDLLRSSLHQHARSAEPTRRANEADVRRRVRRMRRRRHVIPAVGAAAMITVGVGVIAVRQASDDRTSTAADGPGGSRLAPFSGPTGSLPRLVLPGWTTRRYEEHQFDLVGASYPQVAIYGDDSKMVVSVFAPPMGFSLGDGATRVDVNGVDAGIVESDNGVVWLSWSVGEETVVVESINVERDEVVAVARGLSFDSAELRVVAVTHVPGGMEATLLDAPAPTSTVAEYQFEAGGRNLQLVLYSGGQAGFEARVGERLADVTVLGRPAVLVDYGDGRYRVDVLVGEHTWEFDGRPFASVDDFLAAVDSVQQVDPQAWQQSLADAVVSVEDREPPEPAEAVTTVPAAK